MLTAVLDPMGRPSFNRHLFRAGIIANMVASNNVFKRYQWGKARNTLQRQAGDLKLFAQYLTEANIHLDCAEFQSEPRCWRGVTWGIVDGFVLWMLSQGYAVSSVNVRLSTIKTYAKLAVKAGAIEQREGALIQTVTGYDRSAALNADSKRDATRVGNKKAESTRISDDLATQLKSDHDSTPSGLRNALIMSLLLDHGLRASEVVILEKAQFSFAENILRFYRPKTKEWATHRLTEDAQSAALEYEPHMPDVGLIIRGSRRGGGLSNAILTRITLARAVTRIGKRHGLEKLSPHDCRHYAATTMARRGYGVKELMDWFGWNSPAMAVRYIESQEIQERNRG